LTGLDNRFDPKPIDMSTVDRLAPRHPVGVSFAASLGFDRICHSYSSGVQVLNDISLDVEPGKILCLLGPSGSGKSTLLGIASGIERQSRGRIIMNGTEIAGPDVFVPPEKRSIGMVFQDYALFPHMTLAQNVAYGLNKLSRAEARSSAFRALERVGLAGYADRYPHEISGGEQQRVALARALAPRPAILLLDEPFSGLDSRLRDAIRGETLAALRESRATAIIVTHDAKEAMMLGDKLALLNKGRLVQHGTMEELYNRPHSLFAAAFFSPVNIFEGRVRDNHLDTPLGSLKATGLQNGVMASAAIRISAILAHSHCNSGGGTVPARILSRRFLGDAEYMLLAVNGAAAPVQAQMPCGLVPQEMLDVYLSVDPRAVCVFETVHDKP
jgi:iron(III) transport system ATP-binding protein